MHQQPIYARRRRLPRIEGPYLRDQRESRALPPDPELKGAGPRGSAGRSLSSAIPIRTCCGGSIPSTPLSRWQSKCVPVGGFAYGPRGLRRACFSRPDLIVFMKILPESTGWASTGLGSSPETGAKLVDNAITAIRAYPEVPRVTVDLGYDEPPAPPFSPGADVRQRGHSSPMPPGPAAATVPKGKAQKCRASYCNGPPMISPPPDKLDNKIGAGGRDRFRRVMSCQIFEDIPDFCG